jgi:predicted CxxxxCH...CXXCH cytochrome family protein
MSSTNLKKTLTAVLLLCAGLMLFSCGSEKENKDNPRDMDNDTHPAGWFPSGHASQADPSVCTQCHGDDLNGGVSGISCFECHTKGSPFVLTNCTSCHEIPPAGTTAPDRSGAHAVHNALLNVTGVCNTCHNGAGTGTALHDDGIAEVNILTTYSAKSGTAVHNADGTCSNVSCHGGQTTPVWLTGTIDVNTQCTMCHSFGTTEYNSYKSGQHYMHEVVKSVNCTGCHDPSKLVQNHFTSLNTTSMEGSASATIHDFVGYNPDTGTCLLGCHTPQVW